MIDILFVLRGRPGLGHVIPGLALAKAATELGYTVHIASYSAGEDFLRQSKNFDFDYNYTNLSVNSKYFDWPGLCPYDNGVREIFPLIKTLNPKLCVFGGEYIIGPLLLGSSCKSAMLFNPEIMEYNERNLDPSRYFCHLFSHIDYLLPMTEINKNKQLLKEFSFLSNKTIQNGPYAFPYKKINKSHRVILIANGGGVNFPESTTSYSTTTTSSDIWLTETYDYTLTSIQSAYKYCNDDDKIYVFSCLSDADNYRLRDAIGIKDNVHIQSTGPLFYRYLSYADIVISRSGAGFLADISYISADKLLWGLSGHDEQIANAKMFTDTNKDASYCESVKDLDAKIKKTCRKSPFTSRIANNNNHYNNATSAIKQMISGACTNE